MRKNLFRVKILLLKSENNSNEYIANILNVYISVVRSCIDKYNAGGIESALHDNKGRGRKTEIMDSDITWVINKACQKPKDFGYYAELWYPASFTRFINSTAEQERHPRTTYKYFDEINEVSIPYYLSYKPDDIDIEKKDLSQIIYEVVNRKAAKPTDKDKRAPKPRTRKKREQSATQQA